MPKLNDFFKSLIEKSGLKADAPEVAAILSNAALGSIEIPDAVSNEMDRQLISIESAKNDHSSIKQHYFARAYNGVDKTVGETMDELEVPDDIRKKVDAEKSSTRKTAILARELKTWLAKEQKSGDMSPEDLAKLRNGVNEANGKLEKKDQEIARLKERHANEIKKINLGNEMRSVLSKYKTKFDTLPQKAKEAAINAILDEELGKNEALIDQNDAGQPILKKKDGTNFHGENNVLMTLDKFVESAFVKNDVLLQNNSDRARGGDRQNNFNRRDQQRRPNDSENEERGNNSQMNSRASSMIDATLNALSQPAKNNLI